jgi:acetyl esterase/lipase
MRFLGWTAALLLGCGAGCSAARAQSWTDVASWDAVKPTVTKNVVYRTVSGSGGGMDLHMDVLQVASAKPTPVVVQLHGGGWIRGDRPGSFHTFRALLAAGMSVVTVDYRVARDAMAPAAIGDTRCALAWVKANAAKYNFDVNKVVLYGASAGGHLALMGAYAPASFTPAECSDQPKVAAVLDFYGPTNLVEGLTQHGSAAFTSEWLGADGDVQARAKEMSPMTYIRKGLPPTFIVNGDADHTVDPTQSAQLKKALDAAGVPNGQDIVPGGGHGEFSVAESDKAMLLCLKFLQANGVLK